MINDLCDTCYIPSFDSEILFTHWKYFQECSPVHRMLDSKFRKLMKLYSPRIIVMVLMMPMIMIMVVVMYCMVQMTNLVPIVVIPLIIWYIGQSEL